MAINLSDVANTLRSWQSSLQRGAQQVAGAAQQAATKAVALYNQHERDAEYARRQAAAMASAVRANFAKAQTTQQRMSVMDSPEYQSLPFTEKLKLVPDALQTYGGFLQGVADVASAGLNKTAAQQRQTGHLLLARVADATRGVVTTPTRLVGEGLVSAGRGEVVNTAANAGFAIASATPAGAAFNAAVAQPEVEQKAQKFFTRWDARGQPLYDFKQPDSSHIVREASDAVRLGWNLLPFLVTHKAYRGVKELPAREAARTFAEHTKYETPPGMNASAEAAHLQNAGRGYATAALAYLKSKTPDGTKLPWTLRGALREPTAFADEFAKQMGKRRFDTLHTNPLAPLRETKDAIFGERNLPTGAPLAALASLQTAPQFSLRDDAMRGKITSQKALPTTPSATDLAQQPPKFTGLDGLSTRVVEDLRGKTAVSRQYIENLAKQPHIKAAERELVAQTLAKLPGEKVSVAEFARQMQAATLPLTKFGGTLNQSVRQYEGVTLPTHLRGPIQRYGEIIYQSPVATQAGQVHFRESMADTKTLFPNYFAHARREDLAGNTRRLLEIQSDLFQRGRLQNEYAPVHVPRNYPLRPTRPTKVSAKRAAELNRLQPYRNDWWKRVVREEIFQAAKDGKAELLFPTGETALKIEGLGREAAWEILPDGASVVEPGAQGARNDLEQLTPANIEVGQRISRENFVPDETEWIVSEVLPDGRFKAVPKDIIDGALARQGVRDPQVAKELIAVKALAGMSRYEETFDISGRLDTENPIYQFYEKEIHKFLRQIRPDLERITDERGVTWFRTRIQPQTDTLKGDLSPVLAFKTGGKRDLQSGDLNEQARATADKKLTDRFGHAFSEESVPVASLVREPQFQPRITESGRATEDSVFKNGYDEGRVDQPLLVWERDGKLSVLGGHSRTKGMERRREAGLLNPERINVRVYRGIDEAAAKQVSRGANQGGQYEAHLDMAKSIWESQREHTEPAVQKQNMARGYSYDDYAQLYDIAERDPALKLKIAEGALPSEDALFFARESRQRGVTASEAAEIIGSLERTNKLSRKLFQTVVRLKAGLKKAGIFKASEQTLFDVGALPEQQLEGTLTLLERYEKERAELTRLTNAYKTVADSRGGKLPEEMQAELTTLEKKLGRIEEVLLQRLKQEKAEQAAVAPKSAEPTRQVTIPELRKLLPPGSRGSVEWLLGNGKIPPLAGTPPKWKSHQNYRQWQQELKQWHGSEREKQAAFAARQEAARDPDMLTTGQKEALLTQMNFTGDKWRTDPKTGQKIPKGRFQPKVNVPDVMQLEQSGKAVLDVLRVPEEGERAPVTFRLEGNKELSFRPFILPLIKQAIGSGKEIYIDVNSGGASVVKVLPDLASAGLKEAHLNFFDKEKHLVEQALYDGKLDEIVSKVRETDKNFRRTLLQQLAKYRVNNASPEVNAFAQKYLAEYPDGSFDEHFIEWIEKTKLDGEQIPIPLQGSEYYEAWRQTILNAFGEITLKEVRSLDDAVRQAYRDRIATRGNQGFIGLAGMKSKAQSVENFIAALKADAAAYTKAREAGIKVTIYSEDGKQFVRARMLDLRKRGLVSKAVLYTDPPYIQTTRTYLPQVRDHTGRVALAEYTTPDGLEKIYQPALREIPNGLDFIATNDVAAPYLERFLTYPFNHRVYAYKEHTTPTSLIHTLRTPEELRQFRATERFKSVRGYVPAQRIDPKLNPGGNGFGDGEPAWSDFLDDVKQKRELPEDVRRAFVEERLRDLPKPKVGAGVSTLDPLRAAEAQDGQRFGVLKDRVRSLEEAHHEQHVEEMKFDAEHQALQAETGVKQGTAESALAFQIAEGDAEALARAHSHPGALRYAKWARKQYDEWLDRMNVERVAIGRDPIVKRQNYMTHYQDLAEMAEILRAFGIEMNNVPAQMLAISEFTKPNSRFFQYAKRREGTRHTPDAVGAVLSYKHKAFEQIHMTRPLKLFRDILEYRVRAPTAYEGHRTVTASYFATKYPHAYEYWTDYLNSLAGKRDKFDKYLPNVAGGAGLVRRLFARGSIGGNIHTVLIQPAAIANAIRETGAYALPGYGSLLDPTGRWAKYALAHSRVLLTRRFEVDAKLERLFGSMKAAQAYDAVGRVLTKPVQAMDVVTATGAWLSGFFHARHWLKLSANEAYRYADDVVVRTQSSGNAIHRPPINRGEIKTTFGQFQTWVYNEYSSIVHDTFGKAFFGERVTRPSLEGDGIRGLQDTQRKGWSRIFWLVVGSYLVNELYNQILGEDVTLSPIHIGKALLTGDRERAVENITTAIPFASTVRFGGSPAVRAASGIARLALGDESQRADGWQALKSSLLRLLPAGGQASKTLGALPSVTSGELKIGNETIPLDGTAEKIRALLLGKYGTKAAQSYFTARELGIPYDLYLETEKLKQAGESAKASGLIQTYRAGKDYKNERRDTASEMRETMEKTVKAGDRATFEQALAAYFAIDPVGASEYIRQLKKPKPNYGLTPATDKTALGSLGVRERVDFYLQQKDEAGFREYLQSLPPKSRVEVVKYLSLKAKFSAGQTVNR